MTLAEFQKILKKNKIDAYLITRNNMFLGQDILPEENKIMELTGFSGSAGNLIVFRDKAVLFVDGRYEIQSKLETNPEEVEVHCTKAASFFSWLIQNYCSAGKQLKLCFDPWCWSIRDYNFYSRSCGDCVKFIEDDKQLLGSRIFATENTDFELDISYAGVGSEEKIAGICKFLQQNKLQAYLFTAADSVSWILNRRSRTLPDSPVVRSYLLVTADGQTHHISDFGCGIKNIAAKLRHLLKKYKKQTLGLSFDNTPQKIISLLSKDGCKNIPDPAIAEKAVKNPVELQGMINAHRRDAVAVIEFLSRFEQNRKKMSELDVVEQLLTQRKKQNLFFSGSFETIAGSGPNGAIVHYAPTKQSNRMLDDDSLLLLDSGAQYYDGTTDITRTLALGTPSPQMVEDFTVVLKSHIALASSLFPEKTEGQALDGICRRELWLHGKNYNHGTGHGVGCFLNVHEGPHSLSPKAPAQPFKAGMVTSIEPGYYKENAYGIRIENLYYVAPTEETGLEIPMLRFVPLTLVPIDKRLINKYLLNEGEILWLNDYHQKVYNELRPLVSEEASNWLKEACSPL